MAPRVGPEARDMVRRLLTVDPAQRMTWQELNRHPWVAAGAGVLLAGRRLRESRGGQGGGGGC